MSKKASLVGVSLEKHDFTCFFCCRPIHYICVVRGGEPGYSIQQHHFPVCVECAAELEEVVKELGGWQKEDGRATH